jgi:hypothetical protein
MDTITNCDYYMFGWKCKVKINIYHPLLTMHPLMDNNLIILQLLWYFLPIVHQLCQLYNMMNRSHVRR